MKERNLLLQLLRWVVANLRYHISELIVELILLPKEQLLDLSVRLVVINDGHQDLVKDVEHVLLFQTDYVLVNGFLSVQYFRFNTLHVPPFLCRQLLSTHSFRCCHRVFQDLYDVPGFVDWNLFLCRTVTQVYLQPLQPLWSINVPVKIMCWRWCPVPLVLKNCSQCSEWQQLQWFCLFNKAYQLWAQLQFLLSWNITRPNAQIVQYYFQWQVNDVLFLCVWKVLNQLDKLMQILLVNQQEIVKSRLNKSWQ